MRTFAFFALAAVAGTGLVFLACSSDEAKPSTSSSSSGSLATSSSSGNATSSGSSGDMDIPEGGTLAPDKSCVIYCTPPMKATKIVTLPRDKVPADPLDTTPDQAHQVAWTNPTGGLTQDSETATVTLAEGQESQWLAVSGFDFSAVTDAHATWGLIVELTRQSDDGGVTDSRMEVIIDGQQDMVRNHPFTLSWPRLQIGTHHYGQAVDTWGVNLNPSDVRTATFGARVAARRLPGITSAPIVATIDSMKVAVCACDLNKK